ncbi:MAG TPA: hypothetical protein PKD12_01000 [Nitrospira sp.]|nr:hypothetical protein [Nitrospira sp.]
MNQTGAAQMTNAMCIVVITGSMRPGKYTNMATATRDVELKAEEVVGHQMGIRSVPHFLVDGTYAVSGARNRLKYCARPFEGQWLIMREAKMHGGDLRLFESCYA